MRRHHHHHHHHPRDDRFDQAPEGHGPRRRHHDAPSEHGFEEGFDRPCRPESGERRPGGPGDRDRRRGPRRPEHNGPEHNGPERGGPENWHPDHGRPEHGSPDAADRRRGPHGKGEEFGFRPVPDAISPDEIARRQAGHAHRPEFLVDEELAGTDGPRGPRGHHGPHGDEGFGPRGMGRGPRGGGRGRRGRAPRGDVRTAVLLLLAEEPMHGYQLMRTIAERTGGRWSPSPGAIYPTLSLLEDEGLVETSQDGGRKLASLTAAGRTHVDEHRSAWADPFPQAATDSADETVDIRALMHQLGGPARDVARTGTDAQIRAAAQVLEAARRSLYRVLAGDHESFPMPTADPTTTAANAPGASDTGAETAEASAAEQPAEASRD